MPGACYVDQVQTHRNPPASAFGVPSVNVCPPGLCWRKRRGLVVVCLFLINFGEGRGGGLTLRKGSCC